MKTPALILFLILIIASSAHAVDIDALVPPVSHADGTAQLTVIADGLGSMLDIVRFPAQSNGVPVDVSPFAVGTDYVRVIIPVTSSGLVQAWISSSGEWTESASFELTWSQHGQWASGSAGWNLNSAGAPGVGFTDTETRTIASFNAWECNSDFNHNYLGSTAASPAGGNDGVNVLGWGDFGMASSTIANCGWFFNTATNDILSFDIAFNSASFTWVHGDPGSMDVMNIATHETGHAVGFYDQYGDLDEPETMYGWSSNGQTKRRSLELFDVVGVESVYGHTTGRSNIQPTTLSGWHGPISPRNIADVTGSFAPLPALLNGNVETYFGAAATNNTAECLAGVSTAEYFFVDGTPKLVGNILTQLHAGFGNYWWSNLPVTVRGGLHTLGASYDSLNEQIESNESDNIHEVQFAYTPAPLIPTAPALTAQVQPPGPGSMTNPNCVGFESATEWWGVVAIVPDHPDDDYDIYLYSDDKAPLTGFRNPTNSTFAGAGATTEYMVVNGNVMGNSSPFNVGVVEWDSPADGGYSIQSTQEISSTEIPASNQGEPIVIGDFAFQANSFVQAHEIWVPDPSAPIVVRMENLTTSVNMNIAVFGPDQASYQQYAALASSVSPTAGADEQLTFSPPSGDYYLIVVTKIGSLASPAGYRLTTGRAATNIIADVTPTGWNDVIVPRDAGTSTVGAVPLPSELDGNTLGTWVNYASHNSGPGTTPPYALQVLLDGVPFDGGYFTGPTPAGTIPLINRGPFEMRGGRHTIGFQVDYTGAVFETNELDNTTARQFVWSPLSTALHVAGSRAAPPVPGTGVLPNSDGLRFIPAAARSWVVGAAAQQSGDDVDLVAYDDYAGSLDGFSNERGFSGYAGTATEFVVGHFSGGISPVYPAVVRYSGTGTYAHDQDDAQDGRIGGTFQVLDQEMGPNRLVDIYSLLLSAGETYSITLRRTMGSDDIEFEVFAPLPVVNSRGGGIVTPVVHNADLQYATFTAPTSSWYPVVVFRTDGEQSDQTIEYDFLFNQGQATAAPDPGALTRVSLSMAQPNPSPGQSSVSFSLPQAGTVQIEVYDVRGRRVKSLVNGRMPPGRHEAHWNGTDEQGQAAASGLYFLRMRAGGTEMTRRVTIVR